MPALNTIQLEMDEIGDSENCWEEPGTQWNEEHSGRCAKIPHMAEAFDSNRIDPPLPTSWGVLPLLVEVCGITTQSRGS